MNATERRLLAACEEIIGVAERYRLKEAKALRTIRDSRLYRQTHATFEDYCRQRWGFSRQHAQRLIDFAEVAANLSPTGLPTPALERHARPLVLLTPDQQRRAWQHYLESEPRRHTSSGIAAAALSVQMSPATSRKVDAVGYKPGRTKTPIRWFGGKHRLSRRIASLFPAHRIYCEPFAGGAAVLFAKPLSEVELINDVDGDLVNFFTVLRERGAELQEKLRLTPFSRKEHKDCKATPHHDDDLERARRFFVRTQQSYGGIVDDQWEVGVDRNPATVTKAKIDGLDEIVDRLRAVEIEGIDFRKLLQRIPDRSEVLIYADPPYLPEVRTRRCDAYRHELSGDDHIDLLEILTDFTSANIAVSGYRTKLYDQKLKGWRRYDFRRPLTLPQRAVRQHRDRRTDCLWTNW